MWIRDSLSIDLPGVRAVIYGYNTKLDRSQSFQSIPDLGRALISQLQTYGWSLPSAKPVVFLAHSLGGLVLREALVQLDNSSNEEYICILDQIRGAVFFGVPNLGMEQSHFRMIAHNQPNSALVEDIARNSNYLQILNDLFSKTSFSSSQQFYWAYETSKSPTVLKMKDGKLDRNGPPAILVSPDSATCKLIETNPSITFPIDETHSDMTKFKRDSEYYHIVISKLSSILEFPIFEKHGTDPVPCSNLSMSLTSSRDNAENPKGPMLGSYKKPSAKPLESELEAFKGVIYPKADEEFKATDFDSLQAFVVSLQQKQEQDGSLMYMRRLEPFMVAMQEYVKLISDAKVSVNTADMISYLWGPMLYILRVASPIPDVFHSVLDAYRQIGEELPAFLGFQQMLSRKPYMMDILIVLYKDILGFHKHAVLQFQQRHWQGLFSASWRDFTTTINHISRNLKRHRMLMESGGSFEDFEMTQNSRQSAINTFRKQITEEESLRRETVKAWLCPFSCETQQDAHRITRSVCQDPGRWLIDDLRLQNWLDIYCSNPLLWLNGKPGAGKTILASVVIDKARLVPNSTLAFFYCKHNDGMRNSFIAVARSILAQILLQNPRFLPYFHEKAYLSDGTILSSPSIAGEMLQTTLNSCDLTYIVIDGLDECGLKERINISNQFREIVDATPLAEMGSIRCLFVSQDDGTAQKTLGDLPFIRITTENQQDLRNFAAKIEEKFGKLRSNDTHIGKIITARAQGMFIFAEVLAKYLESQLDRAGLLSELHPAKLPVQLDDVYKRILSRILESRSKNSIDKLHLVLGWIVWAKRPLRWREIQGAISIDTEQQKIDHDTKLAESPTELFASLVELEPDGTVQLIHETAREFLSRTELLNIQPSDVDYSLSLLSLAYLAFPEMDKEREDHCVAADLQSGIHAFYDYASACWAIHLQAGIPKPSDGDKLNLLLETLEPFIELHWSSTAKPLKVTAKVQASLSPVQSKASSELYGKVCQAVEWSRKQLSPQCVSPTQDEALDLWQVTRKIRSVLEKLHAPPLSGTEIQSLRQLYGSNWFKCTRVSCHCYHQGFPTAEKRDRHTARHDRPFLCVFDGCQMQLFGCVTEQELTKHVLDWHGIDAIDGDEYPPPPKKPEKISTAKNPANFHCPLCPDKSFTRKANLNSHLRAHNNDKPFACVACGERFTRKSDCDRHEKGHGDKKLTCSGQLKDGSEWGCKSSFSRADKLESHLRSKTGQKCIKPLLLQKLQEGGGESLGAEELDTNADALLAEGLLLPSFNDFLQLCGLDKSEITRDTIGK
ncbi:hypothetical protein HYFRA_00005088 [Hymenoscyphus fraxineus]|uniref:C2H2-type domain-containing protein n=1 Tax=Hymenoscyphus fraxineus TaxID=746836 RepID=A0A9N9PW35_9HELO|nr:hypothetical protein HYFRA_00005088 [Hymenoscyphus fraxineus]